MRKDDSNAESVVLYTTPDGAVRVQAIIRNETLWLTQLGMSELFEVDKSSISRHLKNIFASGELDEKVVVAKIATTTQHGAISGKTQSKDTNFYNLDAAFMVLGVVYRVRLTLKRYAQTGTSKAYAYRVNEIEVLLGTLGGRIALATDPTGTTSICRSILLNGVPEVNGLVKEFS